MKEIKKLTLWLTIIVTVCATVVSFSLAGCKTEEEAVTEEAPAEEEAVTEEEVEVEREPVTIELWTQHSEDHPTYTAMVKAADVAKEKYNITVNIVLKGIAGLADSTAAAASLIQNISPIGVGYAGLFIVTVPLIIIFFFTRKYYVEGLTLGSVK